MNFQRIFLLPLVIGIYANGILLLGYLNLLREDILFFYTVIYLILTASIIYFKKTFTFKDFLTLLDIREKSNLWKLFFGLIVLQLGVNLIGALGPELGFDALWYHLTIPKIYLAEENIFIIPGNLLYYSSMPQLTEMIYLVGLIFETAVVPKLTHYTFGLLTIFVLYYGSKRFYGDKIAIVISAVLLSNLVFSWEQITAYIDLGRTFFEVFIFFSVLEFTNTQKRKWIYITGVILGLAISTKLLSLGTLIIVLIIILVNDLKKRKKIVFTNLFITSIFALLIPLPWFVRSFLAHGNPVYPFFTDLYPIQSTENILIYFQNILTVFLLSADPINPIYLLLLPITLYTFKKWQRRDRLIALYGLLSILVWSITPNTGGGRFILPYLPVFSVLSGITLMHMEKIKRKEWKYAKNVAYLIIISLAVISIIYRGVANAKYIPVILGSESKQSFLSSNLNFSYGDFYDIDGFFDKNISEKDKVLLFGFHNLYYVDFPYTHDSWIKKGDKFNYIATQNVDIPERFATWNKIYENDRTNVKVYKIDNGYWIY